MVYRNIAPDDFAAVRKTVAAVMHIAVHEICFDDGDIFRPVAVQLQQRKAARTVEIMLDLTDIQRHLIIHFSYTVTPSGKSFLISARLVIA